MESARRAPWRDLLIRDARPEDAEAVSRVLIASIRALRFYRACGWQDAGPAAPAFGAALAQPMRKELVGVSESPHAQ